MPRILVTQSQSVDPDGINFVDRGLGVTRGRSVDVGKLEVATLRDVDIPAPYFHNDVIQNLEDAVRFHLVRDREVFVHPEVRGNMTRDTALNIKLRKGEIKELEKFLKASTNDFAQSGRIEGNRLLRLRISR